MKNKLLAIFIASISLTATAYAADYTRTFRKTISASGSAPFSRDLAIESVVFNAREVADESCKSAGAEWVDFVKHDGVIDSPLHGCKKSGVMYHCKALISITCGMPLEQKPADSGEGDSVFNGDLSYSAR